MYKLESKPLTLSGIYTNGWRLYKATFLKVVIWSLILGLIHIIPYFFGYVGFLHQDITGNFNFSWTGVFTFVVLLVADSYFLAGLFYIIYLSATEQKVNLSSVFRHCVHVLIPLYISALIYFIATSFGLWLFIFPAVFIGILFSMFLPYVVIESQNPYKAFESSMRLVWGNWWQTFFVLVVPYTLFYLLRNFVRITHWAGEWQLLIEAILIAIIIPYFYAVLYIQYNNIKVIKALPKPISERPRTNQQQKTG